MLNKQSRSLRFVFFLRKFNKIGKTNENSIQVQMTGEIVGKIEFK